MILTGTVNIRGKELVNPTVKIGYAISSGNIDIEIVYNDYISKCYSFDTEQINAINKTYTITTDYLNELGLELIKTLQGHENIS